MDTGFRRNNGLIRASLDGYILLFPSRKTVPTGIAYRRSSGALSECILIFDPLSLSIFKVLPMNPAIIFD